LTEGEVKPEVQKPADSIDIPDKADELRAANDKLNSLLGSADSDGEGR